MRFSFKLFLLIFLAGCAISLQAQVFSWREPGQTVCFKLDFETNLLYQSTAKGAWIEMGPVAYKDVQKHDLYANSNVINPVKLPGKTGTYLMMECSGQLYHIDLVTRTLTREDATFYRGANCQANQFVRKNSFYSFGGYGFWQSTNIMTEYNPTSKDWTHILVKGEIPSSIHKAYSTYLPEQDRFLVFGSRRVNQTESADDFEFNFSIFDYNFTTKTFRRIGEIFEPILRSILVGEFPSSVLAMGQYIVISPSTSVKDFNHDLLYIIDTRNNFKGYLWTNPARFQVHKTKDNEGVLLSIFASGDRLYLPQELETVPFGTYKIVELPIKTLLSESKSLGPIMERSLLETTQYFALIFLVIVVVFVILWSLLSLKRRRKKHQITSLLGPNEKQFLDFLQLNYQQGYVSGHQIIAFFGKHKSSPESQRQFRAKLIEGLNKSLGLVFPGEQVLDIQADEKDQRMLTYRLTNSIYQELKKL